MKTSWLQARFITSYAQTLNFQVGEGKSDSVVFPNHGPSDLRLGYTAIPGMISLLEKTGFTVSRQSRFSEPLKKYAELGFYPPYKEKDLGGLQVFDAFDRSIYRMYNPQRIYGEFTDIPQYITDALLFIENRHLLSEEYPKVNPAIDWGRFAKAGVVYLGELVHYDLPSMGGSTLATQIEKFRHSEGGLTSTGKEKLLQMFSASVRVYRSGEETLAARKELVRTYVNSVPLAAAPGVGEILGVGDGMYVWYGVEFEELNRLLREVGGPGDVSRGRHAEVLKQVLSLMIGHRRPSYYLFDGREELESLTNSYLRLLADAGIIPRELSAEAQLKPLAFRDFSRNPALPKIESTKGANLVRNRLAPLFKTSVYNLDRMDLTVRSTLDIQLQEKVDNYLQSMREPDPAAAAGLVGKYLLTRDQAKDISYSFTLFERTDAGNLVRIQTDTTKLPFDINEGSKLELGSTAKLRTLATYLEIIAEIYAEQKVKSPGRLVQLLEGNLDPLTRWTCNWLVENGRSNLTQVLEGAMQRSYSASPSERFFTGGGVHTFNNFSKDDNGRVVTVTEALENSINLPFVRVMQDIVNYTRARQWENYRQILKDDRDPRRKEVLDRFIEHESRVYLGRFWKKYQGKTSDQQLELLLSGLRPTPVRLAVIFRHLRPDADENAFSSFLRERVPAESLAKVKMSTLFKKYATDAYNLQDKGYLASIHPLELWLLAYLQETPQPSLADAADKSLQVRKDVYGWLLKTRAKNARDARISTVLEVEAFSDIHRRWARLGYPFDHLVPSLATALGSSGDKPAGLAELMGIILNNGRKVPTFRLTSLEFAKDTPYETTVQRPPVVPEQVMLPEVAAELQKALAGVVASGTARRLSQTFFLKNGTAMSLGGKTGTGDNRIVTTRGGQRISSKARNRTATFVFFLGDRHFGTLTAFVTGNSSASYSFTSALPLQVLKSMAPVLLPWLQEQEKDN